MTTEGAKKFADITSELSRQQQPQNQFGIVLDGIVVSAPAVNEPILGGSATISGSFTADEARALAQVLKYGALPLTLEVDEVSQISPTLGNDQLQAGLIAGAFGLLLVMIYLITYYRALGMVAVASLFVAAAILYFLVVVLGNEIRFTMTLAGIAGAIVAIGITADSFVIYFERIRDELRDGKKLKSAVDAGWTRARRTLLAADFVSLLAAIVLYYLSVGNVRGFAFMLGLTTLIDVAVAFYFTRPLVVLFARSKWLNKGSALTGLSPKRLGVLTTTEEVTK
jgi:preprotein translocase subunit SecD